MGKVWYVLDLVFVFWFATVITGFTVGKYFLYFVGMFSGYH